MSFPTLLKGKVALLTGASRGIGLAIARVLLEEGIEIMLNARNSDTLTTARDTLLQDFPQAHIDSFAGSVSQYETVEAMVAQTLKRFGRLDILINNAAIAPKFGLLQETSRADLDATLDINLKGPLYAMHIVVPVMVDQGAGGIIININSIAGKKAFPYSGVYCASKFGLTALTDSVAEEQRQNNIKVIGIYPGEVHTPMWDTLEPGVTQNPDAMLAPEDVAEAVRFALKQSPKSLLKEITLVPQQPVNHSA